MKLGYLPYVLKNLKHRKLRSWLTVLGILIGFATVVSLYAMGQGLQYSIEQEFAELGSDKLIVQEQGFAGGTTVPQDVPFEEGDVDTVEETRGVERAIGYFLQGAQVSSDDEEVVGFIIGMPTDEEDLDLAEETFTLEIDTGRRLEERDTNGVTLGSRYADADELFEKPLKIRDKVELNGEDFTVVGIYQSVGNPTDDSNIYVTEEAIKNLYGVEDQYSLIMAQTEPGFNPEVVAEEVEEELRDYRNLEEGKEDFFVQTFAQVLETFAQVLLVVQVVLVLIALVSLIVGVVNIMNTMYTAVLERTSEIGLMKAVGATNEDIRDIFLIESGIIGFIGGAAGVICGWILAELMGVALAATGYTIFKPFFPWWLMLGSLVTAFVVGVLSGVLPAIQAANMEPVEALRYE